MRKVLAYLVVLFVFMFALPLPALAEEQKPEIITLGQDEVVDRDYFAGGETVEIYGTVNGDVYAAGGQVFIDGVVNGDVLVAGGVVKISGVITQDVRAAGGQLTISGNVEGNVTIGGGNVDISESAQVSGNVVAGAGNLTISGPIEGNIMAGAGNFILESSVGGDVETGVGVLRITPNGSVDGNLTYYSDTEASIDEKASIAGEIMRKEVPEKFSEGMEKAKEMKVSPMEMGAIFAGVTLAAKIIGAISTLIIGLILLKLYPNYLGKVADNINKKPWPSLGIGFIALIATPVAGVILLITLVGIPLALMLFAIYGIYLYLAKVFVVYWIGEKIFSEKTKKGWLLLGGVVVFAVITFIPVIGGLARFLTVLFGLGAGLMACKKAHQAAIEKKVI